MASNLSDKVAAHYAEQARAAELATLQRELADSVATADVECYARRDGFNDPWFRVANLPHDEQRVVDRAVRYLDLRGLIERDGERVRFVEGA